jgi:hypothetical protein
MPTVAPSRVGPALGAWTLAVTTVAGDGCDGCSVAMLWAPAMLDIERTAVTTNANGARRRMEILREVNALAASNDMRLR